jgi:hypothetical protein
VAVPGSIIFFTRAGCVELAGFGSALSSGCDASAKECQKLFRGSETQFSPRIDLFDVAFEVAF